MYIVGIGDVMHDKSVCLARGNVIEAAIEEERINRIKHGLKLDPKEKFNILELGAYIHGIADLSVAKREKHYLQYLQYCFYGKGISMKDIDCLVISSLSQDLPFRHQAVFINHHVAHCASAYYPSPFTEAAILAIDGYGVHTEGKSETVMFAVGHENKMEVIDTITGYCDFTEEERAKVNHRSHMIFKNSLGTFYYNLTILLGLGYYGEGKVMGLSSYGEKNAFFDKIKQHIALLPDGKLEIDNRAIFFLCKEWLGEAQNKLPKDELFKFQADLAFAHQLLLQEMYCHLGNHLYKVTRSNNLCLAGGVALNSVANSQLLEGTPFKQLFVQPAAGDNGIAIGCALYGAHALRNLPKHYNAENLFSPYTGRVYTDIEVERAAAKFGATTFSVDNPYYFVAKLISDGKIVGWYNGGSEVGPRALGNRSLLADPRRSYMKDYLNQKVKYREHFRPYAPAVLEEKSPKYFHIDLPNFAAPYMLFVVKVRDEVQQLIPAVTHVDGTARVQTVRKDTNPDFYRIIESFEEITNIPIVLNTSFNGKDEPIVETPEDAIRCFLQNNIDYLFINKKIFVKKNSKV